MSEKAYPFRGRRRRKGTAPFDQAAGERDRRRGEQGDDQMRRQVEDVRVADVVAERERRVGRVQRDHEDRAPRLVARQLRQAGDRQQRRHGAELLPQIEPVHRRVVADHRTRHVHHHRVAPVRLGDVEPEPLRARRSRRPAGRSLAAATSVRRFHAILRRAGARARDRQRHDARRHERSPAAAAPRAAETPRRRAPAESSTDDCRRPARRRRRSTPAGRWSAGSSHRRRSSSVSATSAMWSA